MVKPDHERLMELLAFAHGDKLADPRCGLCGSKAIWQDLQDHARDVHRCKCGAVTTGELIYRNRVEETAKELGVPDMNAALAIVQEWI